MHLPIGLLACFPKRAEETLSILVVLEDSLPAITAIDDVIHRAGVLERSLRAIQAGCCASRSYVKRILHGGNGWVPAGSHPSQLHSANCDYLLN